VTLTPTRPAATSQRIDRQHFLCIASAVNLGVDVCLRLLHCSTLPAREAPGFQPVELHLSKLPSSHSALLLLLPPGQDEPGTPEEPSKAHGVYITGFHCA
jgi:hypothetical protein